MALWSKIMAVLSHYVMACLSKSLLSKQALGFRLQIDKYGSKDPKFPNLTLKMQRRRRKDRLTKVVKRAQQIIGMQDTNSSEDKKSCTKRTWLHLFSNCDDAPKKVIHKHDLPMKGGKKNSSIRLLQFLDLELSLSVCPANISGTGKPVPLIWEISANTATLEFNRTPLFLSENVQQRLIFTSKANSSPSSPS